MELTNDDIAEEWRRRSRRAGLARVMRDSQPAELNPRVTDATRLILADYLDAVSRRTGRPVRSALEVGCGIGRLTPTIADHAEQVVALDMTSEMLDAAAATCAGLGNIEFHQYPAARLPWGQSRFDVGVCIWVLMHVLAEDELAKICHALSQSTRHLVLIEYEQAAIPVGRYSRLRSLDDYLRLLPGVELVEQHTLDYGGDRSFAALLEFPQGR
ncbi:MAG TPA: class I SAM-dependent methyltransferase [Pseudonocardiaceae bacterium]|jgi:2-polyprenyl-3-methyl-5-hydroxy-6-metoxy-1,4-benzoquinol methylase|nr:class I SAM-dependent methyltransferase [Pseudonocardiaceae bacterium]